MSSGELNLTSGVPLYRQIMDILRREILDGVLTSENPITEAQLLDRFDVSRAPIQQALKELSNAGFVYRKQGKGTFPVSGARVERPADLQTGNLYHFLKDQGLNPTSTVSDIGRAEAPVAVQRRLKITDSEPLLHFSRTFSVDGEPLAVNEIYIRVPEDFIPTAQELEEGGSAFELLEQRYGITLERAEHEAWATAATAEQAAALGVREGSPLLVIDTLFIARGNLITGWRSALHRADQFKYHFVTR